MEKNITKKTCLFGISIICMIFFSAPVYAHYPWINLSDYTPETGSALEMTIGWGHKYPLAGFLKKSAVETLEITGPEKSNLKFISDMEIKSQESISTPGAYVVAATRKAGFYTKTAQGGKQASKENLKNVIACSFSHMCMKAIVNAGDGKGKVDNVIGHPMEILPLKNPVDLNTGDYMPIRVLCNGKPFNGYVFATYAGFSTEKETFAYAAKTDKKGNGKIRILKPGVWMIKASQEQHYPDEKVCDIESFIATLTFEVN
ncbi:DUF4198 domain-containing protein [Desulfobacula toluolica]|uniref:Putative ABC-type Co2+ transport system periplasmic component-like protein n=1 Tax=Desulfobacula toluolica (strain DSM 7467 / Tol2) TaxID=651182 RepID=K0NJS1_DESTT|nr:DUF4198 domain-containing protein [Desulfobacula toluolica]CCK79112.1 putative ABC-type Co2+ transport system periplasmic component-like protein [Desulfobacula toluolica Tol2]